MNPNGTWTIKENEKTRKFEDYENDLTKEEWLLMAEVNAMIEEDSI
jgi:hypothetical protein